MAPHNIWRWTDVGADDDNDMSEVSLSVTAKQATTRDAMPDAAEHADAPPALPAAEKDFPYMFDMAGAGVGSSAGGNPKFDNNPAEVGYLRAAAAPGAPAAQLPPSAKLQLSTLPPSKLRHRAVAGGATDAELDAADDAPDRRAALAALVIAHESAGVER